MQLKLLLDCNPEELAAFVSARNALRPATFGSTPRRLTAAALSAAWHVPQKEVDRAIQQVLNLEPGGSDELS